MPKSRLSRRKLLAGAAPLVAAPALVKLGLDGDAKAAEHVHHAAASEEQEFSHAAMYGEGVSASTRSSRRTGTSRLPPASIFRPGPTTAPSPVRSSARPRTTCCAST